MLKPYPDRIAYGGAVIDSKEKEAINKVIDSQGGKRWTIGEESLLFEKELASQTGVAHAIVVNSGSSALLVAITSLKLPEGSKVIIPALNFPTAYSSLLQNRLVPVVVDCDENLNINFDDVKTALEIHPEVKAVVAIHIAGNIVNLPELKKIIGDRILISDNCDGYSGKLYNRYIDTYSDVSCVSFHAAHIITTGEGGAILTNDATIASRARKIREWGRESGSDELVNIEGLPPDYRARYTFTEIGYNLKPLELQCAMGRIQLKKVEGFKRKRRENYAKLYQIFSKYPQFRLIQNTVPKAESCWFGFPFICEGILRSKVMDYFESLNIETRTIFSGNILRHPAYKGTGIQIGDLKNSNIVMERGMFISNHPLLTNDQFKFIEEALRELC